MSPPTREAYLSTRNLELTRNPPAGSVDRAQNFHNGMALEREFVAAGGLLLAGPDPTGDGGVLPGFGDQREIELLVDAGFTPVEAIKIATLNGATYLGRDKTIGSIAPGKNADLVVVRGDPSRQHRRHRKHRNRLQRRRRLRLRETPRLRQRPLRPVLTHPAAHSHLLTPRSFPDEVKEPCICTCICCCRCRLPLTPAVAFAFAVAVALSLPLPVVCFTPSS